MGRTACTEPQCLYKGALYLFIAPPPQRQSVNAVWTKVTVYSDSQTKHLSLLKQNAEYYDGKQVVLAVTTVR